LWTAQTGGIAEHTETIQNVESIGGVYSIVLGVNGTPITALFDKIYYLGVSVNGGQELTPRPLLTHAPYALSLLGDSNQFPSTGEAKVDALNVAGTATMHALEVTGVATLPSLNVTGVAFAQVFFAASGTPATGIAGKGYSFGTGGDRDGGLFSTGNGTVSMYADGVERVKIFQNEINLNGTALAGVGYAFVESPTSGMFGDGADVCLRSDDVNKIRLTSTKNHFDGVSAFENAVEFDGGVTSVNDKIIIAKPVNVSANGIDYNNYSGTNNPYRRYFYDGENNYPGGSNTDFEEISVRADQYMLADGYYAASDRRIKKDLSHVDQAASLAKLQRLHVTDYRYKDEFAKGKVLKKGVIAQEVEETEPAAITTGTHFIPSVYTPAKNIQYIGQQFVFSIAAAHGLQKGDKVRIFEGSVRHDLTVEAATKDQFAVNSWGKTVPAGAFVFGKEVSDFKSVDYDHLFTMNIAATQELAHRIELLEADLAAAQSEALTLLAQKAGLANKQTGLDRQLTELDKRMKMLENGTETHRK